jgi:hypothetical protein
MGAGPPAQWISPSAGTAVSGAAQLSKRWQKCKRVLPSQERQSPQRILPGFAAEHHPHPSLVFCLVAGGSAHPTAGAF